MTYIRTMPMIGSGISTSIIPRRIRLISNLVVILIVMDYYVINNLTSVRPFEIHLYYEVERNKKNTENFSSCIQPDNI